MRVQLRGAAGQVQRGQLPHSQHLQHQGCGVGIHHFGALRAGVDVAVQAALVALVAQVHLQRVQGGATQRREIGIERAGAMWRAWSDRSGLWCANVAHPAIALSQPRPASYSAAEPAFMPTGELAGSRPAAPLPAARPCARWRRPSRPAAGGRRIGIRPGCRPGRCRRACAGALRPWPARAPPRRPWRPVQPLASARHRRHHRPGRRLG